MSIERGAHTCFQEMCGGVRAWGWRGGWREWVGGGRGEVRLVVYWVSSSIRQHSMTNGVFLRWKPMSNSHSTGLSVTGSYFKISPLFQKSNSLNRDRVSVHLRRSWHWAGHQSNSPQGPPCPPLSPPAPLSALSMTWQDSIDQPALCNWTALFCFPHFVERFIRLLAGMPSCLNWLIFVKVFRFLKKNTSFYIFIIWALLVHTGGRQQSLVVECLKGNRLPIW